MWIFSVYNIASEASSFFVMFGKCEFCEKEYFENVNFMKNETLKMWILWKMRLWNCEFCQKWDLENVIFVKNEI